MRNEIGISSMKKILSWNKIFISQILVNYLLPSNTLLKHTIFECNHIMCCYYHKIQGINKIEFKREVVVLLVIIQIPYIDNQLNVWSTN